MNKKQLGFAHLGILLLVVIFAAVAGGGYYVWHKNHKVKTSAPTSETQPAAPVMKTITGAVTKFDLTQMPSDGPGYYTVKDKLGVSTEVVLTSGESSCDRQAILVPKNVRVGDDVTVTGVETGNGLTVCTAGTSIKLKQAYLSISQWGVRAPYDGSDTLSYSLSGNTAIFVSKKLSKLEAGCNKQGGGAIARYLPTDPAYDGGPTVKEYAKTYPKDYTHLGNYYYRFIHDNGPCTEKHVDVENAANDEVQKLVKNLQSSP